MFKCVSKTFHYKTRDVINIETNINVECVFVVKNLGNTFVRSKCSNCLDIFEIFLDILAIPRVKYNS
jgi:hypothetical protein